MAENQYKCEVCGATFNTEAEWEKHNRIKHALYTCENCRQTFNKEEEFAAQNASRTAKVSSLTSVIKHRLKESVQQYRQPERW